VADSWEGAAVKASQRAHNARRAREAVEAVRDYSADEIEAAARFLGLEHMLPDRQAELPHVSQLQQQERQQGVKGQG
jgi:hypothetical protein